MCKARGIESHIKFSVLEIYKKTDLQLENTVTNTLIPVLDVEPRGLSDLISSKRACCAVWLREGGREKEGEGMERDHNYGLSEAAIHTRMWSPPRFKEGSLGEG